MNLLADGIIWYSPVIFLCVLALIITFLPVRAVVRMVLRRAKRSYARR